MPDPPCKESSFLNYRFTSIWIVCTRYIGEDPQRRAKPRLTSCCWTPSGHNRHGTAWWERGLKCCSPDSRKDVSRSLEDSRLAGISVCPVCLLPRRLQVDPYDSSSLKEPLVNYRLGASTVPSPTSECLLLPLPRLPRGISSSQRQLPGRRSPDSQAGRLAEEEREGREKERGRKEGSMKCTLHHPN